MPNDKERPPLKRTRCPISPPASRRSCASTRRRPGYGRAPRRWSHDPVHRALPEGADQGPRRGSDPRDRREARPAPRARRATDDDPHDDRRAREAHPRAPRRNPAVPHARRARGPLPPLPPEAEDPRVDRARARARAARSPHPRAAAVGERGIRSGSLRRSEEGGPRRPRRARRRAGHRGRDRRRAKRRARARPLAASIAKASSSRPR